MKTAVEWLYETLWKQNDYSLPSTILEQAKKMEKQQIKESHLKGQHYADGFEVPHQIVAEQYYNETYNK